jgi:hypothetical protein
MKILIPTIFAAVVGVATAGAANLTPIAVGDPAVTITLAGRPDLALASGGAVAFSSSDLTPDYAAPSVNDGVIDHSGNSWIPLTTGGAEFVAVRFTSASVVGTVVWSGQTGYNGRSAGTWVLQYTTDASPAAGSTWIEIGTYIYAEPTCGSPMPRTCFAFTPVANVTAVRLLVTSVSCGLQAAVQELEVYGPLSLSPSAVDDAAVAAAIAGRPNLALASAGGLAFSSSDLGLNYSASDVNNGITDNSGFSWIPANAAPGQYVGVALAAPADVDSAVWHGQALYNGRSGATYSLDYTTDASPGAASSWTSLGVYTYVETGCVTPMPRSFFSFPLVTNVTGVRLVITSVGCGIEPAVQELEVYGPLVSPPTITTPPVGGSYAEGSIVPLSVVALGGTGFQWQKDEVNIPGATSSGYTISNLGTNDAGSYRVRVANSAGFIFSDAVDLIVTPMPVYASYSEAVLTDNPIHYYPLDETDGTTAADLGTMSSTPGTYAGGITLGQAAASPRLGKSALFDGNPGTLVDLGLFHPGDSITVEAWANLDPTARAEWNAIVARWDGSYELDFAPGNIANFVVRRDGNGMGLAAGSSASTRGQWHHLVGVFSGGVMTIYVDGVKGSEQNIGGVLQNLGPAPDRVMIGATRSGTEGSFNFKGLMDEVAIYDYALNAAQIRTHFRASVPPEPPSLTIEHAVLLSWPSFPPGYVLQASSHVDGPYTNVTKAPITENGINYMTVPIKQDQLYFRLVGP